MQYGRALGVDEARVPPNILRPVTLVSRQLLGLAGWEWGPLCDRIGVVTCDNCVAEVHLAAQTHGSAKMKVLALLLVLVGWWCIPADAVAAPKICNCQGYAGPGGPCYAGPGGPAYNGPGGPAYDGPGGPCYKGPGGPKYGGPGGPEYSGPGGPKYDGPGGPAYDGPGGPAYSGPGGACYAGPGGPCYSGPGGDGEKCPAVCKRQ
jgi:hypothetical protein